MRSSCWHVRKSCGGGEGAHRCREAKGRKGQSRAKRRARGKPLSIEQKEGKKELMRGKETWRLNLAIVKKRNNA